METKELDMLIVYMGMELKLPKTICHFLVAQLQDLEPNVSFQGSTKWANPRELG
jgi:hypothetical protein